MLEAGALHSSDSDMPILGVSWPEAVKFERGTAVVELPAVNSQSENLHSGGICSGKAHLQG